MSKETLPKNDREVETVEHEAEATADAASEGDETAAPAKPRRWRSKRGIALIIAGLALLIIAALVVVYVVRENSAPEPDPVAVTVPVALEQVNTPAGVKIGVVATLGQGQAEGAEWASAAEGAAVAQYRLARGGSEVEFVVVDDRGTPEGATEAAEALVNEGVSGIVLASSGSHIEAGLAAVQEAGIPVVLPYESVPEGGDVEGVWSMAPTDAAVARAMNEALAGAEYPLLLSDGTGIPEDVEVAETLPPNGGDLGTVADQAAKRTGADESAHGAYTGSEDENEDEQAEGESPRADAIVLSGHPRTMATLATELQSRRVSAPILLAPSAVSPGFTQAFAQQGGSISPSMQTVGLNVGDAAALGTDGQSRATSAYLQALRELADDPDSSSIVGEALFAESAPWADVRTHDAIVALATAAGRAGSAEPQQVREALSELTLVAGDGIATGELDFAGPQVVGDAVVVLHATGQSLGLRPTPSESSALSWFQTPEADE